MTFNHCGSKKKDSGISTDLSTETLKRKIKISGIQADMTETLKNTLVWFRAEKGSFIFF